MPRAPAKVEQHLMFECPALQGLRDRYSGLIGDHAATMLQLMWQHDPHALVQFIEELFFVLDAHGNPGPQSLAPDQP